MNVNRLKQYSFNDLVSLKESLSLRIEDLERKIARYHLYRMGKSVNIKNMYSQVADYRSDILDIKLQIEKIVTNESKL